LQLAQTKTTMLVDTYKPNSPEQFIGPARSVALDLQRLAARSNGAPIRAMFLGKPGAGKTSLARYLVALLGAMPSLCPPLNGTEMKVEEVHEIANSFRLTSLFGYRVVWIEEVDKVPTVAQVRFLTLLDELPKSSAIIATSNCKPEELEERFQTRFAVFEVERPSDSEIIELLRQLTDLPPETIAGIATFAAGNVRQALNDADRTMLCDAAQPMLAAV